MALENILVLSILAGAMVLFVTEKVRVDVVALLVLLALILTGLISSREAFAGFSSPAVITVWAVFIISGAVYQTGIADMLAVRMLQVAGPRPQWILAVIMLTAGVMSAFMNNVGAVAILMPAVLSISRQLRIPPSKLLMPLAFAALLGGNMTLIGTPPNILAAEILEDYGHIESFGFFDFTPTGILVLGAGMAYMLLFGRYLLPERTPGGELLDEYPVRPYVTEVQVTAESSLVGKTIAETEFGQQYGLNILRLRRANLPNQYPTGRRVLAAEDVLLIEGPLETLLEVSQSHGLQSVGTADPLAANSDLQLAEIGLTPRSRFKGRSLIQLDFRQKYGVSVLAIRHSGKVLVDKLGNIPIEFGDALLVQTTADKLELLRKNPNFMILDKPRLELKRTAKAPLTLAILLVTLLVITVGWLDVATMMLMGAVSLVLFGVITMDEAYQSIDWQSVFLIAGMLPLGMAMEQTGTARLLADYLVGGIGEWGPVAVLAGLFLLTALLTEVISNAAATVLMIPIAIDAALGIGVDPRPLVMATVIAASTSFMLPVGHQVNVIIYGPGGYKFSDYARVGVGLNLLLLVLVTLTVPLFWPF